MLVANTNCAESRNILPVWAVKCTVGTALSVLINAFTEMLDFTPSVLVNIFTVESCNHIHPHIKLLNSHLLHFNNSYILNSFKTISQVLDISDLSDLFFPSKPKHPACWCEIHFSNSIYLSQIKPGCTLKRHTDKWGQVGNTSCSSVESLCMWRSEFTAACFNYQV